MVHSDMFNSLLQRWSRSPTTVMIFNHDVYWLKDRSNALLDPTQFSVIEHQAQYLLSNAHIRVEIQGFASWDESDVLLLSEQRARCHRMLLVYKYGVDSSRVRLVSFGSGSSYPNPFNMPQWHRRTHLRVVDNF